jgi:CxxC-x17-CxxC domain-containing protein
MDSDNIKKTCRQCGKEFWVIKQEQEFLKKMDLPHPVNCPTCRETRRLKERGERQLYRTTCQQCNKNIIVSFDPKKETRKILCKPCYLDWMEKNPVLLT